MPPTDRSVDASDANDGGEYGLGGEDDDDALGGNPAPVASVPMPAFVTLKKKAVPGKPRTVPAGDIDAVEFDPPPLPESPMIGQHH